VPVPIQLQLQTVKSYLRRKSTASPAVNWTFNGTSYTGDVPGLKQLADAILPLAVQTVTLKENSFEGGHAAGEITFDSSTLLAAIEQLIAELDPLAPPEPPMSLVLDYSYRQVQA
jgi:hypothetical protein